jgi:hypothetical protein
VARYSPILNPPDNRHEVPCRGIQEGDQQIPSGGLGTSKECKDQERSTPEREAHPNGNQTETTMSGPLWMFSRPRSMKTHDLHYETIRENA